LGSFCKNASLVSVGGVCVLALLTDSNPLFPLSWFAEACTGTSAIFIYEFDAGGL